MAKTHGPGATSMRKSACLMASPDNQQSVASAGELSGVPSWFPSLPALPATCPLSLASSQLLSCPSLPSPVTVSYYSLPVFHPPFLLLTLPPITKPFLPLPTPASKFPFFFPYFLFWSFFCLSTSYSSVLICSVVLSCTISTLLLNLHSHHPISVVCFSP